MSAGVDRDKRRFLTLLTTGVGAIGVGFTATPFVLYMTPSARARAARLMADDLSLYDLAELPTLIKIAASTYAHTYSSDGDRRGHVRFLFQKKAQS